MSHVATSTAPSAGTLRWRLAAAIAIGGLVALAPRAQAGTADICDAPPAGFNVIIGTAGDDTLVGTEGKDLGADKVTQD